MEAGLRIKNEKVEERNMGCQLVWVVVYLGCIPHAICGHCILGSVVPTGASYVCGA